MSLCCDIQQRLYNMASFRQVRFGLWSPVQPGPSKLSYLFNLKFAQNWAQKKTRNRRDVLVRLKRQTGRRHPTFWGHGHQTGSVLVSLSPLYSLCLEQDLVCNHRTKKEKMTPSHRQICLLDVLDWFCWKSDTSHTFQNKDRFVH